ncbi:MAG TPA: hypothetical protein VLA75_09070 [Thermoanaerobaculia bacterium]|nr:hypothetical protein [Thermoanaerobaculia bacterium]
MTSYDEFQEEVRRRRRERWLQILLGEPPGRPAGRRPRDPEQERLLTALDRARLARERHAHGDRGEPGTRCE